jgi:hypothetical protein
MILKHIVLRTTVQLQRMIVKMSKINVTHAIFSWSFFAKLMLPKPFFLVFFAKNVILRFEMNDFELFLQRQNETCSLFN